MSTWTLKQVFAISGLRIETKVDLYSIQPDIHDDVLSSCRIEGAGQLIQAGHTHGVELWPDDIAFRITPPSEDSSDLLTTLEGRWAPTTHMVRLNGGAQDGQELIFQHFPQPLRLPQLVGSGLASDLYAQSTDITGKDLPVQTSVLTYEWSGWSERDRVWLYSVQTSGQSS